MAILSKYYQQAIQKYEELGYTTHGFSQALVGAAVLAYALKIAYPLIRNNLSVAVVDASESTSNEEKRIFNDKCKENNNTMLSPKTDKRITILNHEEAKISEVEKLLLASKRENHELLPGLNVEFIVQLQKLLKIMIPKPICYETGLLGVHTLCLVSRTFLSIYVASLEGAIVKFIVRKDVKQFAVMLMKWFGIAIPATFVNSMIRYLENKLALAFRTRLVRHSYCLYFKNQNYYRVSNLDARIENADHRLTEDIAVFASSIAHLYSSLTKPCFDLMLIGIALMRSSQKMKSNVFSGPAFSIVVISLTAHILRVVSPKFGELVSEEANRYGYLRHIHSRIITNAEEIAFYGGHKVELSQLRHAYNRLVNQMNTIFTQRLWYVMLEQFFMKYVWSGTGMVMVSLPILTTSVKPKTGKIKIKKKYQCLNPEVIDHTGNITIIESSVSERTQYLTTARNLLISAADAIERLMSSYKEVVALAGYTYRVAGMLQVFEETAQGIYNKSTVAVDTQNEVYGIVEYRNNRPVAKGKIIYNDSERMSIMLNRVPVVTPNCDVVVPSLTLRIDPGMHLLITGPNGCGKSSLFRILSGLWPIYAGELHIPRPIEGKPCMFYIPQRPYMSIGSLCDQIIYPETREDMLRKGVTEVQLKNILKMVSLEHIAQRDNFDVIRDWKDILSGGEKQRMAVARLFYHKPKYALLDECTSAVSIDVESSIYEIAKNMGITLLTITHRPSLWRFHTHILEFNGQGSWSFRKMESNEQQKSQ